VFKIRSVSVASLCGLRKILGLFVLNGMKDDVNRWCRLGPMCFMVYQARGDVLNIRCRGFDFVCLGRQPALTFAIDLLVADKAGRNFGRGLGTELKLIPRFGLNPSSPPSLVIIGGVAYTSVNYTLRNRSTNRCSRNVGL
jgi:hypothetical protein